MSQPRHHTAFDIQQLVKHNFDLRPYIELKKIQIIYEIW